MCCLHFPLFGISSSPSPRDESTEHFTHPLFPRSQSACALGISVSNQSSFVLPFFFRCIRGEPKTLIIGIVINSPSRCPVCVLLSCLCVVCIHIPWLIPPEFLIAPRTEARPLSVAILECKLQVVMHLLYICDSTSYHPIFRFPNIFSGFASQYNFRPHYMCGSAPCS